MGGVCGEWLVYMCGARADTPIHVGLTMQLGLLGRLITVRVRLFGQCVPNPVFGPLYGPLPSLLSRVGRQLSYASTQSARFPPFLCGVR